MRNRELNVVTGVFAFTGKYITRRLIDRGEGALTLTGHPGRQNPFGDRVRVAPFNFDNSRRWRPQCVEHELVVLHDGDRY
ncbi:MAG TPA: hypothetical protein VHS28_06520 [Chloroflexota bacterium]|nr:hypothetical protein [Chloroflexota bacterium]